MEEGERERELMCSGFGFGMEWRRGGEGGFSLSLLCSRVYCILYAVKREGRETRGSCWPLAIFCKQAKAAGGARQLAGWLVGQKVPFSPKREREREREKPPRKLEKGRAEQSENRRRRKRGESSSKPPGRLHKVLRQCRFLLFPHHSHESKK